ncbi:alpha/beta hydrolase [Niabella insulamsoli]|uniref:alpha/beta hydrolase n=1 Tax=Niabella insulamsoli TaxID=3144874 RepID=UPI0031FCF798
MKIQNFVVSYFRNKIRLLTLFSKKRAAAEAFHVFCTPYFRMVYEAREIENAEPLSFQFEGQAAVGYRWNKGADKKLLIAHGFRSASANFKHLANALAAKGYEVIAFDAPAHGKSGGKQLTAITYKMFIEAICRHFGDFDASLCHSFGGLAVSMNLAEDSGTTNSKTVLIAPAANSRQLIEAFFREMRITDLMVQQYFFAKIQQLSGRDVDWFSLERCAPQMGGQVFWVHDHDDKVTPIADAMRVKNMELPHFHFLFTENLGHRRIYRDPNVINAVVDFLQ